MREKIPKIKKKINAFLVGEEGKISKQSLLKVGAMLGGAALGAALSAKRVDACSDHTSHISGGWPTWPATGDRGACVTRADSHVPGTHHGNDLTLSSTGTSITSGHAHCKETHYSSHCQHGSHASW